MKYVPDWYELLLLGLAAGRVFQLLAHDDILDRPRRWILRLGNEWQEEGDPVPDDYRIRLGVFLTCPYCFGFWIGLSLYLIWIAFPEQTLMVSAVLALSTAVVAFGKALGRDEE